MKTGAKISLSILGGVAATAGCILAGYEIGCGPFRNLFKGFGHEVDAIERRYSKERTHEIIFYGASNFRLWKEMESDLRGYRIQNHAFGGSTDHMLVQYADRILYPYEPDVIFFQTGSNDYVELSGTDDEKAAHCIAYKRDMFSLFHARLPNAKFVVMSGLPLPKRSEYTAMTFKINKALQDLCSNHNYMSFVDASALTFSGASYAEDLFRVDGIHLNRCGQRFWCDNYIRPQIEKIIQEEHWEHLRKTLG